MYEFLNYYRTCWNYFYKTSQSSVLCTRSLGRSFNFVLLSL